MDAAPELFTALHRVLLDLRRDMQMQRELDKNVLAALRDIHRELEYLRTQRERETRIERLLERIEQGRARDERIMELLDKADVITGRKPAVDEEPAG